MFADLASIRPRICPKNAWPPWLWRRQQIRDHTVKDRLILRYKAKTDLVSKSDQKDRLDPEPGRTPAVHLTGPLIAGRAK